MHRLISCPTRQEVGDGEDGEKKRSEKQQEVERRSDTKFNKFMGSPSMEAAIKLGKNIANTVYIFDFAGTGRSSR